jgi:aldose 1-epimerase
MPIQTAFFGSFQDQVITEYSLINSNGMVVSIINYGGIITRILVPDKHGLTDVVLGFDSLEGYLTNTAYIGCIIGRFTNRIAKGTFNLHGNAVQLDINSPPNHLHGGFHGFDSYPWKSEAFTDNGDLCLRLNRTSPDGEGGYPGKLEVTVVYRLTANNSLNFEVSAVADRATPVSIAQHSYFNLRGHNNGDISPLQLQIMADAITETDEQLIPTGTILPVNGTCYDFKETTTIGTALTKLPGNFDINYQLHGESGVLRPAAVLQDPCSGRVMTIATTLPGIQFYDGTHLTETSIRGKHNSTYYKCSGLCLETQHYPDAVNQPHFPSPILLPNERYEHSTTYTFTLDGKIS